MTLNAQDYEDVYRIIQKATRTELNKLQTMVEREINMSQLAIDEGFEVEK